MNPGVFVPIFDQDNLRVPTDIVAGFDVAGWRTIAWAVNGAGTDPAAFLWLRESWSFPQDLAAGWPSDLAQPAAVHQIAGFGNPLFIDYQLRAVTPRAPLLSLGLLDTAGEGRSVHARVWGSPYELTTADLWPGPFTLAEGLVVASGGRTTLQVPAYVGPVIAHAWSDATVATSRIDLRSGAAATNRIDILWKPANGAPLQNAPLSREVMLPPGPNTIVCVNDDLAQRTFDVALTPISRR